MSYRNTTQVPNEVVGRLIPELSGAELKVILIIIRQTLDGEINILVFERKLIVYRIRNSYKKQDCLVKQYQKHWIFLKRKSL